MTYCVAVRNEHGLVFLSDSRTNAGVDQVGTFRKMHVFEVPGERVMVLLTAGNLGVSQSIASGLRAHMAKPGERSLASAPNMFSAAKAVGDAVRRTYQRDAESLKTFDIVYTLTNGNYDTDVIANLMYKQMFAFNNFGRASAVAVVLLLAIIPIMVFNVRQFRAQESVR